MDVGTVLTPIEMSHDFALSPVQKLLITQNRKMHPPTPASPQKFHIKAFHTIECHRQSVLLAQPHRGHLSLDVSPYLSDGTLLLR